MRSWQDPNTNISMSQWGQQWVDLPKFGRVCMRQIYRIKLASRTRQAGAQIYISVREKIQVDANKKSHFSPLHSSNKDFRTTTSFHHHATPRTKPPSLSFRSYCPLDTFAEDFWDEEEKSARCRIASRYLKSEVRNARLSEGWEHGYVGRIYVGDEISIWCIYQCCCQDPDIPCIGRLQLANEKITDVFHHLHPIFQALQTSIEEVVVILRFISIWIVEDMEMYQENKW